MIQVADQGSTSGETIASLQPPFDRDYQLGLLSGALILIDLQKMDNNGTEVTASQHATFLEASQSDSALDIAKSLGFEAAWVDQNRYLVLAAFAAEAYRRQGLVNRNEDLLYSGGSCGRAQAECLARIAKALDYAAKAPKLHV